MPRPTFAEVDLSAIRSQRPRPAGPPAARRPPHGHRQGRRLRTRGGAGGPGPGARGRPDAGGRPGRRGRGPARGRHPHARPRHGRPMPADEVATAIRYDLQATVDDTAAAAALDHEAAACGRPLAGAPQDRHRDEPPGGPRRRRPARPPPRVARLPHLVIEGAYTHFACAGHEDGERGHRPPTPPVPAGPGGPGRAHVLPPCIHTANSAAIVALGPAHFNMVRPGLAMYGIRPSAAARGRAAAAGPGPEEPRRAPEARAARRGRQLRSYLAGRARLASGPAAHRLRRRVPAGTVEPRPGPRGRPPVPGGRRRSAWTPRWWT